jgi:putative MATE family efflux protein
MAEPPGAPTFTQGPVMRHVVTMTVTSTVGLMAIFVVDVLNLFYIAMLGEQELAAAIGYAGTVLFFTTSLGIGVAIAGTAVVSRAIGAGDLVVARRMATSALVIMALVTGVLTLASLPFIDSFLTMIGAKGRTHDLAWRYLMWVMPATPALGIGMMAAGLLRAVGDANRAMHVTLSAAIATAILDPILIFLLHLGIDGAAIASIVARLVMTGIGLYGVIVIHRLAKRPSLADLTGDAGPIGAIAVPAVLTNIATPVGNAAITGAVAPFGDQAVAAWAVIGRLVPLAFGAIFALSGAVGPIIGQNLGAGLFARVRRTLTDSLVFTLLYCVAMWALLAVSAPWLAAWFRLSGEGAAMVVFFCRVVAGLFVFNGALFVANAAFNNLGAPVYSTVFNWGRATLGTIPFVWFGGQWYGANGVILGQAAGGVLFGVLAVLIAYRVVSRVERDGARAGGLPPLAPPADAPLASGKGSSAIGIAATETRPGR